MFSPVGRYEPRRPSGARISTIVGTRASAPIRPPSPSSTLPTIAAATIAPSATGSESPSPNCVGRQDEERAGDDHEQRDGEVRPEQQPVEHAEHAQALGNGVDAPGRRVGSVIALPSPA